ncbi:MAG: hypothetical protein US49_C0001G0265 [candidate division TM6 bacterium GW2011_GWF2_37_49]|nr:MAG: hypothetical protein US49_C0001G0265 [candidate division TM6 bacterium GW2011_GWF2_37_49]
MYCHYYQAQVNVPYTWFITGVFRNENNIVFERAMKDDSSRLEFFVAPDYEDLFLVIMQYLQKNGYVLNFEKKENRLI